MDKAVDFEAEKAMHNLVAAASSDPVRLKELKEAGVDIDAKNGTGETALHVACGLGNIKAIENLIDAGADKDALSNLPSTPLGACMANLHMDAAAVLLRRGANPDKLIDTDISPLGLAISYGDKEFTRLLLEHKASQSPLFPSTDPPAVIAAARGGQLPILQMLIEEFGATVDQSAASGETPLASALSTHHNDCFDYLLGKGADIHFVNAQKLTPVYAAAAADNAYATEELLRRGIAVDGVPNESKVTPLMSAAFAKAAKAAKVLLDHGAAIDTRWQGGVHDGMDARRIAELAEDAVMIGLIDAEARKRHVHAVEQDAAKAHHGVAAAVKVRKPLSFKKTPA